MEATNVNVEIKLIAKVHCPCCGRDFNAMPQMLAQHSNDAVNFLAHSYARYLVACPNDGCRQTFYVNVHDYV